MPCRLLLNISNIDPQTHLPGAFEASCVYTGDKTAISTPGKYSNHTCYKPIQNQPNNKQLKSNFMRRLLLLLCLTLAMAIPAMADEVTYAFSTLGTSNITDMTNLPTEIMNGDTPVATITYARGTNTNNNKPGYYTSNSTLRIYTGNTLTITAKEGVTLNSVVFTLANGNFTGSTANNEKWEASNNTWNATTDNSGFTLTGASGNPQISEITINYTAGTVKETNPMAFGKNAVDVFLNSTEYDLPVLADKPEGVDVTFSSSDTNVATVNETSGAVSILAAGTTTISATAAANDTYYGKTVEYTLKVIDANVKVSAGYKLLTDLKDLANGTKGIIVNSDYALGAITGSNKYCNAVNVTIKDNFIEDAGTASVVTFVKNDAGKYALKIGDQYLVGNGTSNDNTTVKYQTAASYGTITLNSIQLGNSHSERYLGFNISANPKRFANYKTASENINSTQIFIETEAQPYEAPAAVDATFEGNTSIEGENLYIVAGENVTVTLPVPEGVLAYYYINDDATMIRYTAPFEVSAGDIVGYYTEQYGLKSEEKMFEVKGIDFSGIAPELKGFNGEHAVMVSFDLTGFDGSVWYKFNDAATAAPALITPAEEGYTEYAEPFKIAAVGTLTYKAESHGLMSAPVEKSITGEDLTTGVENVVVSDDSEAAYYDLNGRRLTNPAAGIYIRIAGGKATKAIIR